MTLSRLLSQPVPDDFPNGLAHPLPHRPALRARPGLWAGLVLLCLVPRALMVLRVGGICPDAVLYIDLAKSLEAGDLHAGLREMRLNTFPVILMVLHRVGLDWVTGGQLWNIAVASLVVLPLYGWARRQFDDRVALVACLLYAVHPKLIVWSPELIRDPTFWFLFMLSIYLLWRGVTEVRIGWFLAAGVTTTLSWLTRFEGLFLFIPLTLWTFWRWRALTTARPRLVLGAVLSVVALPAVVLAINLVFLRGHDQFALSRLRPLSLAQTWVAWVLGKPVQSAAGIVEEVGSPAGVPFAEMVWEFFPTMTRGLSPAFALLMFGGMWGWRRVWSRRDHQPLFYTAMALLAGIWINLWYVQVSCPRYALPIVLMASPFAALGLLGLTARCLRWAAWLELGAAARRAAAAAPLAAVVLLGAAGVLTVDYTSRKVEVELGRWIRENFGPGPQLAGPIGLGTSVGFYAEGRCVPFPLEPADETIVAVVRRCKPDVLLLQRMKRMPPDRYAAVIERMRQFGLEPVDRSLLPARSEKLHVLVRPREGPRLAGGQAASRADPY
jgi:hypothetical protein